MPVGSRLRIYTIHRICDSAFRDCVSMRRLVVENDRVKIGERAFENCASLESINCPTA